MKILFVDGTRGFSPTRLEERPAGGIITSLTLIPRYLASKGHEVTVYSIHEKTETREGVLYTQDVIGTKPDIIVFNRNMLSVAGLEHFPEAKKVWWLHDIVDPAYLNDDAFKSMDRIVALSDYNVASFSDFYGIPNKKFDVIPNGVDRSVFRDLGLQRDRNLYVTASAPIKGGLSLLGFVYAQMKRLNPDFRLVMYCSQRLHDLENDPGIAAKLDRLKAQGVEVLDPIPQKELAEVFNRAWGLLMPNTYPEICSNTLLQAQACGLPVVASNIGSASEFIDHGFSGLLTKTYPHDIFWWWKDFAQEAARLYVDVPLHDRLSANAGREVKGWQDIGAEWNALLESVHGNAGVFQVRA